MRTPAHVGPFDIVTLLGMGATSTTLLGVPRSDPDSSSVNSKLLKTIKMPRDAFARDRVFLEAFENEANLASTLHHPNIVRLEQVRRDPDVGLYLVSAFIEGMDLGELIAQTRAARVAIDWPIVVSIGHQIARALECAHTPEGSGHLVRDAIIHRDLCPSNILLGRSGGTAYVIDFGFARSIARAAKLVSQQFRGRLAYTAPELFVPNGRYDARADLFSLGVVLYEALTGRRPFTAMHNEVMLHLDQVSKRAQPKIEALRYEWSPSFGARVPDGLVELVRIIDRLLDADPDNRFPSAAKVSDSLGAIPLPASVYRDISDLVMRFQPVERRSLRGTGQHPSVALHNDGDWSSTDPTRVAAYFARGQEFDPERDGVRVTPQEAEQLIAAFAPMRDVSLEDVRLEDMLGVTDPMRPAIAFDTADDEPPTVPDPPIILATHASAVAVAQPVIPTTRPSHPRTDAIHTAQPVAMTSSSLTSSAPSSATRIGAWTETETGSASSEASHEDHIGPRPDGSGPVATTAAGPTPAPSASTGAPPARPSPPLAGRHYRLPAFHPSERQTFRAKLWIAIAFAVALLSLSVLAAVALGVFVPSLASLFMGLGFAGLGASLVPGIIALVHVWKSRRSSA